jgi:hypothetical protein
MGEPVSSIIAFCFIPTDLPSSTSLRNHPDRNLFKYSAGSFRGLQLTRCLASLQCYERPHVFKLTLEGGQHPLRRIFLGSIGSMDSLTSTMWSSITGSLQAEEKGIPMSFGIRRPWWRRAFLEMPSAGGRLRGLRQFAPDRRSQARCSATQGKLLIVPTPQAIEGVETAT